MKKADALVLLGVTLLAIGVFLPVAKESGQTFAYFDFSKDNNIEGDGPGVYLLIVGAVALLMVSIGRSRDIWLPGVIAFWVVFLGFNGFWADVHNTKEAHLGIAWVFMWGGVGLMQAPLWYPALGRYLSSQNPLALTEQEPPDSLPSDELPGDEVRSLGGEGEEQP